MSARARQRDTAAPPVPFIGPYKLGSIVGQGVFAKVRVGEDEFGRKYAIKEFDKKKLSENHLHQIERELNILRVLNHPHIAQFVGVLETNSHIFLVMEYVSGGELYEYVHKTGKLSERDGARLFHQISSAVRHCHQINVVHRDLKPENILLTAPDPEYVATLEEKDRDGLTGCRAKVVDLGLANFTGKNKFGEPITDKEMDDIMKTQCGSPHYASPEVLIGKPYHGRPCDIWSLGIILYALLCARLPFHAPDFHALKAKICAGRYQYPSHLSQGAKDLITSMLKINPEDRITIDEVIENKWLQSHGPHPTFSSALPSMSFATDDPIVASPTIQQTENRCKTCRKLLNLRTSQTGYVLIAASASSIKGPKAKDPAGDLCTCDEIKEEEVDSETVQEEFYRASETGDIRRLRELINWGAEHTGVLRLDHQVAPKKWAALHYAAVMGHTQIVEALLTSMQKVDINSRDYKGRTALMLASSENKIEVVSVLLECGADLDLKDNSGHTAFTTAMIRKNTEISELLTQAASDKHSMLSQSPDKGGGDGDARSTFKKQLKKVCEKGDESALKVILAQHFQVAPPPVPRSPTSPVPTRSISPSRSPSPPRSTSPTRLPPPPPKSPSSVSTTATTTASPSRPEEKGEEPDEKKSDEKKSDEKKSDEKKSDEKKSDEKKAITLGVTYVDNWTALHYAARDGHVNIVRILLTHVIDAQKMLSINSQTSLGWTPLMLAAWKGHKKVVQLLLEFKADVVLENKEHKTAADLAREGNHREIAKVLDKTKLLMLA